MPSGHVSLPPRKHNDALKRKKRLAPILIGIMVLVFALILTGVIYIYTSFDELVDNISDNADDPIPVAELAKSKPLTIMLLGLDARPQTGTMNTDVMMLISLNPNAKSATVVSIPRDARIKVDG